MNIFASREREFLRHIPTNEEGRMHIRWYRPDRAYLSYALVRRVLEIRVWKAEVVLYWHK
jgi:hypothetical protein